jgi:glycosyltransferase involved in cell wall biosynthesis
MTTSNATVQSAPVAEATLTVSVVVPTRNRPHQVADCAKSILATDGFVDLIFVDQSDGRETEQALSQIKDARLRYVRTDTRGVTNGRNIGMDSSTSDIVAFTDDDCRVRKDWVKRIIDVFAADPSVAVVSGRVEVPEEIRHLGYAEGFEPRERDWHGRYPPLGRDWGITANMSIRKSVLARTGAFDPMLGAGAPLKSGGEPDFLFRVLRAGMKVVNANEVVVDHYGIRKPGEEFRKLIMGYSAGTAAAMYKHVRLRDPHGTLVYLRFLGSTVARVSGNVLFRRRPTGMNYLIAFLSGTLASYKFRVDPTKREYVPK